MESQELAVSALKEVADKEKWDPETQIIIVCQFVTHLNKDQEFKEFLDKQNMS